MSKEEDFSFDFINWDQKPIDIKYNKTISDLGCWQDSIVCNFGTEYELRLPRDFRTLQEEVKQLRKDLDLIKDLFINHAHNTAFDQPCTIYESNRVYETNLMKEIKEKYNKETPKPLNMVIE